MVFATDQILQNYWSALTASVLYLLLIRDLALFLTLHLPAAEKELNVMMDPHMLTLIAAIRPNVPMMVTLQLHIAQMLPGRQNALMENPHLASRHILQMNIVKAKSRYVPVSLVQ